MIEILTPATGTRLTTLHAVKEGVPALADNAYDLAISALIDQFSDSMAAWCNWPFGARTVRETIPVERKDDRRTLWLLASPLIDVVSVTINGEAISADKYAIDRDEGVLAYRGANTAFVLWPVGETIVTMNVGYVMPGAPGRTLPHNVERACIVAVRHAMAAMLRGPALRSEEVDGVATLTYFSTHGDALPGEAQALLSRYRRPVLA